MIDDGKDFRFVTDVKKILETLEGSFLSLAECQHELETVGRTAARLAYDMRTALALFGKSPLLFLNDITSIATSAAFCRGR